MEWSKFKYLGIFLSAWVIFICVKLGGLWSLGAIVYSFLIVPIADAILPSSFNNLSEIEEKKAKKDPFYNTLIYLIVPLHYATLFYTLYLFKYNIYSPIEYLGLISSIGIGCGIFGINVAHELGHRNTWHEKLMSKMLLLSSLYMHFFIEHNRGHHLRVSTPEDPASARKGENVYQFWLRSVYGSYISAWNLENKRLKGLKKSTMSMANEMIQFSIIQVAFLTLLFLTFGFIPLLCFIAAAIIGILLLETVNYIEHYGLQRNMTELGIYEKTKPKHSWNSNHAMGRILLFELTRHSDHHYIPNRPYQILRNFDDIPQLPTGYPGMMVLALFPPLWFKVMHKHMEKI